MQEHCREPTDVGRSSPRRARYEIVGRWVGARSKKVPSLAATASNCVRSTSRPDVAVVVDGLRRRLGEANHVAASLRSRTRYSQAAL